MTSSLTIIRDDIMDYTRANFAQPVHRGGVPTLETLRLTSGRLRPYLVVNFSDIIRQGSKSFGGTRGDDYIQPVNFFCVAPHKLTDADQDIAEELQIRVIQGSGAFPGITGHNVPYGGEMVKRGGGGMYVMSDASSKPVADIAFASFSVTVQLLDIPETS